MSLDALKSKCAKFIHALAVMGLVATSTVGQVDPNSKPVDEQDGKDVIWQPTDEAVVDTMLAMAKVTPRDFVIDLGSGDGRTVIAAAKLGARSLGIEFNPDLVAYSKKQAAMAGVADKVGYIKDDFFQADFSQATVLTMFLSSEINLRLRPKILAMKPGARIVSNTITMGTWKPDSTLTDTNSCDEFCTAYLWYVPAKVAGRWQTEDGLLELHQTYQVFIGSIRSGGRHFDIDRGMLKGAEISFQVGTSNYRGRVDGNRITGVKGAPQDLTVQRDALTKAGCKIIREEKISGTKRGGRTELTTVLDFLRRDDQLVVTKLERLARDLMDLQQICKEISDKGASLAVLDQHVDTSTPAGKAFFQMLGVFAEFENNIRRERQMTGIEKAKAAGKYKGRKRTVQPPVAKKLEAEGLKHLADRKAAWCQSGVRLSGVREAMKALDDTRFMSIP